jgi:polar amino acid transport system substrate-binding protein
MTDRCRLVCDSWLKDGDDTETELEKIYNLQNSALREKMTSTTPPSKAAIFELAPGGLLKVGLNRANFLLVTPGSTNIDPSGLAPDIARELGKRLGVNVLFLIYDTPAKLTDDLKNGSWDIAFLAADPLREEDIDFTAAYVEIEASYLVPPGSPITSISEADQEGVRISVANKSAYEMWLTRHIKHAQLVLALNADESFRKFVDEDMDALSGLKPRLLIDAAKLPGSNIIEGRFTAIQQAVGLPKGRTEGLAYISAFIEDIKRSGIVASTIQRNGIHGVTVAASSK